MTPFWTVWKLWKKAIISGLERDTSETTNPYKHRLNQEFPYFPPKQRPPRLAEMVQKPVFDPFRERLLALF